MVSGQPPNPLLQFCPSLFSCWSSCWCWSSRPPPMLVHATKFGVWRAVALDVFYVSMFLCFCSLYLRLCNRVWSLEGSTSSSRSVGMRRSGSLGSPRLRTIHSNSSSQSSSLSSLSPSLPSRSVWTMPFDYPNQILTNRHHSSWSPV